jgi:Peptidase family M23
MRELTYFPLLESYPKTSGYGYRVDPITGAQGSFHGGVDYGVPYGEPVIAPYDGQVTTGYESGAGNWLWVVNGSDMFKSFHHASFAVTGGWVSAGTVIAYIDSTGSSTGSHAHFELWEGGTRIDPTGYLDRAPLRDGPGPGDEEMTEDDFTRISNIVSSTVNAAMKDNYTGARALMVDGDPGVYEIVVEGGVIGRRHIPNPDQIRMLQWVDHLAGTGDGAIRKITDEAMRREFLALPVF